MAEHAQEIFEGDLDSPYMLLATDVKPEWRDRIAAIVHVDGSARVQTVSKEYNPKFHALLEAFAERRRTLTEAERSIRLASTIS